MTDKAKKILLILAPVVHKDFYPIGLAYLVSYIKENSDCDVRLWNLNDEITVVNDENIAYWMDESNVDILLSKNPGKYKEWLGRINSFRPDIVGFSVWNTARAVSLKLAGDIKRENPEIKTLIGGFDASVKGYEYIVHESIDIVVKGEGENALLRIIRGESLYEIPGIYFKDGSKTVDTGEALSVMDLDSLPFPDYSSLGDDVIEIPFQFNRGCKNRCVYCLTSKHISGYRSRSAANIVREIKEYRRLYPSITSIKPGDASKLQDLDLLSEVCDMLIKEDIRLKWLDWAYIDKGLKPELLAKMKAAGWEYICYGLESGSDIILKKMGKRFRAAEAEKVIKDTFKSGIEVGINIIVGFPGETRDEFIKTMAFMDRLAPYINGTVSIHECNLLEGSLLHGNAELYSIELSKSGDSYGWRSMDGENTHELRQERIIELYEMLKSKNVSVKAEIKAENGKNISGLKQYNKVRASHILSLYKEAKALDRAKKTKEADDIYRKIRYTAENLIESADSLTITELVINTLDKISETHKNPDNIKREIALIYRDKGMYEKAAGVLDALNIDDNNRGWLYLERAIIHFEMQEYEEAEEKFIKAFKEDPMNPNTRHLGMTLMKTGKFRQAIEVFRNTLELLTGRDKDDLRREISLAYKNLGEYSEAFKCLNNLKPNKDNKSWIHKEKSELLLKMDEFEQAEEELRRAVKADPANAELKFSLAKAAKSNFKYRSALYYLDSAFKASYKPECDIFRERALIFRDTKKYRKALNELKKIKNNKNTRSWLLKEFGIIYFDLRNYSVAEKEFKKAISNNTLDLELKICLAKVFVAEKRYDEALQLLDEMPFNAESAENYLERLWYRSLCFSGLNDISAAIKELESIINIRSDDKRALNEITILKENFPPK